MDSTLYLVVSAIGVGFLGLMLVLALFEPALPYRIVRWRPNIALDSLEFQRLLGSLAGGQLHAHNKVEVLTNGEAYYEAELQAIREARRSIHLEAYIFQKGVVARRFLEAMTERARAGVDVRMVLDAVGSFATWKSYLKPLTDAGGQVYFYHPIRWYTLPRINNRTHRELLIVDGAVGFVGGAGFGDHWLLPHGPRKRKRRWRDTMCRVEGPAVRDLQSAFAENWLESSGEVLFDVRCFRWFESPGGATAAMVVKSSPSSGRSTRNRMLFQTLLAAAQKSIHINTPYFLPDHSVRSELIRAVQERGVEVKVIVPGKHADHLLTRRSSRRLFGSLLKAGIKIYEYKPSMMHAKILLVDGMWSVVGSTNFDNRSFGINDEVNLAGFDEELAARLEADFTTDLAHSEPVHYRVWSRRSLLERWHEYLGWLLERQQ
jgi:cardiolipin synthase A/B